MKKAVLILFVSFPICALHAQNLVPNPSFEDTIQCTNSDNEFTGYTANWSGQEGGGGLSYFTSQCNPSGSAHYLVNVPKNEAGFQYAHTGVSYAGIYTYLSEKATDTACSCNDSCYVCNYRNYIQVQLTSPLIIGIKYYVTFYVSLGDLLKYACSDIGAYLSDSALKFNNNYPRYLGGRNLCKDYLIPQVANNPITNPLTDTLNWQRITGTYIAKGSEKYIIIGNFLSDTNSHIQYLGQIPHNNDNGAYYYIDDVFVTTDSLLAGETAPNLHPKGVIIKVYPNPANTVLNVQVSQSAEFYLYNELGQLKQKAEIKKGLKTLPLITMPNGIYFYRIIDENGGLIGQGKFIIQK